jgi:hypothetical protein
MRARLALAVPLGLLVCACLAGPAFANTSGGSGHYYSSPPPYYFVSTGRLIAGGIIALAVLAIAVLDLVVKVPEETDTGRDRDRPVGYILHVGADPLTVDRALPRPLNIQVLRMMADGRTQPAAATITVTAPDGLGVDPAAGPSPFTALVWQTGELAAGAGLLVQATAAGGSYETSLAISAS